MLHAGFSATLCHLSSFHLLLAVHRWLCWLCVQLGEEALLEAIHAGEDAYKCTEANGLTEPCIICHTFNLIIIDNNKLIYCSLAGLT